MLKISLNLNWKEPSPKIKQFLPFEMYGSLWGSNNRLPFMKFVSRLLKITKLTPFPFSSNIGSFDSLWTRRVNLSLQILSSDPVHRGIDFTAALFIPRSGHARFRLLEAPTNSARRARFASAKNLHETRMMKLYNDENADNETANRQRIPARDCTIRSTRLCKRT